MIGLSFSNIPESIMTEIDIINIINKYDLDLSTVGWQLPCQFDMLDEDLLEMYKNLLVDYYRINLTLKYSEEFKSYIKGLERNRRNYIM